jgi:spermidine/putrescine-binding protein
MEAANRLYPPRVWLAGMAVALALVFVSGCQKQRLDREEIAGLTQDPYPIAPSHVAPALRILVWPDTIIPAAVRGFEDRYGIKLEITTFSNDDEVYAKLVAEPANWDIIMATQYMGDRMRREGLLRSIPRLNEDIYRNLDTSMVNTDADPQMKYFVPFDYAALGITFNVDYMAGFPRKWEYLAEHIHNPYLYGRIVVTDDMRYALGAAMLYAGRNPAEATANDIAAARDLLVNNVKEFGLRFLSDAEIRKQMVDQRALVAITWSGEAAAILKEKTSCRFLIPEGKSIITSDGFAIPKQASNPESSALFIEYMLHPYVSYLVADDTMYASVNRRSMRHVDRFMINGPSCQVAPPQYRVHMKAVEGAELALYQEAWAAVKRTEPDMSRVKLIPLR